MFFRKFQLLTQALGVLCLFGLAGYGLWMVVSHDAIAWAMPTGAESKAPVEVLDQAPKLQGNLSVPLLMNYQGELKDSNGNPLSGAYNMTFRIYDSVSAGTALWTEQQNSVTVRNGVFSVLLGSTTAMPGDIFHSANRFIGVTVAPYAEMAPRQRLASVPYAVWSHEAYYSVYAGTATSATSATNATNATNADTLDGLDSTAFSRADHNHNWNSLVGIPAGFADGVDHEAGPVLLDWRTIPATAPYDARCTGDLGYGYSSYYQMQICVGSSCSGWQIEYCAVVPPPQGG